MTEHEIRLDTTAFPSLRAVDEQTIEIDPEDIPAFIDALNAERAKMQSENENGPR